MVGPFSKNSLNIMYIIHEKRRRGQMLKRYKSSLSSHNNDNGSLYRFIRQLDADTQSQNVIHCVVVVVDYHLVSDM